MTTPDQRGRPQEFAALPITQLAAWLFSINIRKVAPELREKVRLYQAEAVDVLYRHLSRARGRGADRAAARPHHGCLQGGSSPGGDEEGANAG